MIGEVATVLSALKALNDIQTIKQSAGNAGDLQAVIVDLQAHQKNTDVEKARTGRMSYKKPCRLESIKDS